MLHIDYIYYYKTKPNLGKEKTIKFVGITDERWQVKCMKRDNRRTFVIMNRLINTMRYVIVNLS